MSKEEYRVLKCPPLPHDLAEAFGSFKLAILQRNARGWSDVSRLDCMKALTVLIRHADDISAEKRNP